MNTIKSHFPIFKKYPNLVYLDSSATALKPKDVIDAVYKYYSEYSSNIHRGLYLIAEKASFEYEETRDVIAAFIHAKSRKEIVFTKGATESLNLIASCLPDGFIKENDEIMVTVSEHHANFVPWQECAKKIKAHFQCVDINDDGTLSLKDFKRKLNKKTKIVAFPLISNVTGYVFPAKQMIKLIRKKSPQAWVVIDAAQAVSHIPINVQDIGCDFIVFSGHKMFGPTGTGVLWGKFDLLQQLRPYQYGGDMIEQVMITESRYQDVPTRFEAGTPNIAGIIGLKKSVDYIKKYIDYHWLVDYERNLTSYLLSQLMREFKNDIRIIGPLDQNEKASLVSFSIENLHAHDIAQILSDNNIAVRAGHHCAMPLHTRLGLSASVRISLSVYNDKNDIDQLLEVLRKAKKLLAPF